MNKIDKTEIIIAGLKGIASEVPVLGGLVAAYSEYDNAIKYRNIENFLSELGSEALKIRARIDRDFIKTSEAVSLTRKTIDSVQKEYKKEKIQMFAKFLANCFTEKFSSRLEKESILNSLDQITPLQFSCLLLLKNTIPEENIELGANYNPDDTEKLEFKYLYESDLVNFLKTNADGISNREAEALLSSMTGIGVLENQSARGWTQVGGKQGVIGYRPTKLGLILVEYIETQT